MKNLFIHLRLHSNFSLAEGMLSFDDLSNFCVKNNQPAIAITDTNNLFGALEFSLKMISCGIQPIIGIQISISLNGKDNKDTGEVVLLAKNEIGYKNLLFLTNVFSSNENDEKFISGIDLEKHKDGLLLLTGGIENGFLAKPASLNNTKLVRERLKYLKNIFNENLYVELQRHGIKAQLVAEKILIDLACEFDLPLVATNDCFFQNENKFESHQVLTCIDKGLTISSDKRRILTKQHYLKDPEKMISLFKDIPEAIENTVLIAKRCSFYLKTRNPILPKYPGLQNVSEADHLLKIGS